MIKRVNKIKNFGIFQSFNWKTSIPDFKQYNAIYGWNYSGKTTLARIFRCFELEKLHEDYEQAIFEIENDGGQTFDQSNLNPLSLRVFNSDFIKDNLKWDEEIEPIFLLGEENIQLQAQLTSLRQSLGENTDLIEQFKKSKLEDENKIQHALTSKAREIKNILNIPNYTKRYLEPIVQDIAEEPEENLLSDKQKEKFLSDYRSTEKKEQINEIEKNITDLPSSINKTNKLLNRTVTAVIIEKLKENPELNEWVKKGKELHQDKSYCEFCGNKLPTNLLDQLNKHFSTDYENLLADIDDLITNLRTNKLALNLPDKAAFYTEFVDEFDDNMLLLKKEIDSYNDLLDKLIFNLTTKKTKPFEALTIKDIKDNSEKLKSEIDNINKIIQKHNYKTTKFEEERRIAKESLIKHFASEFAINESYSETILNIEKLNNKVRDQTGKLDNIQKEIKDIWVKLSESVKGADKLNDYLKLYFGTDEIKVKVTEDDKFKVIRSGIEAKNLSEGEKTAIAFAYFIAKLEDKDTVLSNSIIFIDDPVSSLDCNHLFHTYSFIKNRIDGCKQLFIATHNFEFFNLIKDWFNEIEDFKKQVKTKCSCYLIERINSSGNFNANLIELPSVLLIFKSEYHYLFSILYNFKQNPSNDYNYLYNLPNLVRRYLEAFLGFKIPKAVGLAKKLKELIEDEILADKVLKFIHQYSHHSSLPRSLQFPDLEECTDVVDIVLKSVENKDKEHYDALIEAIAV